MYLPVGLGEEPYTMQADTASHFLPRFLSLCQLLPRGGLAFGLVWQPLYACYRRQLAAVPGRAIPNLSAVGLFLLNKTLHGSPSVIYLHCHACPWRDAQKVKGQYWFFSDLSNSLLISHVPLYYTGHNQRDDLFNITLLIQFMATFLLAFINLLLLSRNKWATSFAIGYQFWI